MEVKNKKFLVVGLGISGIETARFLIKRKADVTITDISEEADLASYAPAAREMNISLELGKHRIKTFLESDVIVVSPGVPLTIDPIVKAIQEGVPVIGEIELASRFIREPIVAVTGTNGKTTTTELIGKMLESSGLQVFVGGNIGNPLISYVSNKNRADVLVVELSSFQLDTVTSFRPKVGVLLNITEDHLDRYPDFKAYAKSKGRIFENQEKDDFAVINGSDSAVLSVTKNIKSDLLYFNHTGEYKKGANINCNKIVFTISPESHETLDIMSIPIPGRHNIENTSAAALSCLAAGGTFTGIEAALKQFKGLSHRLEYVDTVNGVRYFDDSKATNVDAVVRAIESFNENIVLIMGGRGKGGNYNLLHDLIKNRVKKLIVMGEAADEILNSIGKITAAEAVSSMKEAVSAAHKTAVSGDIVLLSPACASFDMYSSYAERGNIFCKEVEKLRQV